MWQLMQRILKTFLKNIDIYIVIAAAIVFSLLGIIGTASVQIVLSSTLAILAVLAFSILKNRQDNETIEKTLEHLIKTLPNKNALYETKMEAYKILEDYVHSHHVQNAVLIQYSGITCIGLIRTLLQNGANVILYIQHEETPANAGSHQQAKNVVQMVEFLRDDIFRFSGKLKILKYRVPSTIHAIKIDEEVLSTGWYIYESLNSSSRNSHYPIDSIKISGHSVSAFIAWKGTEEFGILSKTFDLIEKDYRDNSEEVPL